MRVVLVVVLFGTICIAFMLVFFCFLAFRTKKNVKGYFYFFGFDFLFFLDLIFLFFAKGHFAKRQILEKEKPVEFGKQVRAWPRRTRASSPR